MQANCLVFPSPGKYDLASVQKKIILVPQDPKNNRHVCYSARYCGESMLETDEFSTFLQELNQKGAHKEQKSMRKSSFKTEAERNPELESSLEGNLNTNEKVCSSEHIPCLFIKGSDKKLIVFFHANGEDITSAFQFLRLVNSETKCSILAMEYRGYSVYDGQTTPDNIEADATRLFQFLFANKFAAEQLIIFGRSIGCAVSLTLTQKYSIFCAILLSPFISLKKIAMDLYGNCASALLKEAFNNQENCKQIRCPVLIIHGDKDTLVSSEHSLKLMSGCQSFCRLKIIQNMTHTKFNFRIDFVRHLKIFLADIE